VLGVELRFPPTPGHVRTARLVAVAVARRAHLDEDRLDELRLAVGEACARAVRRCQIADCSAAVVLTVDDSGPGLVVEVTDAAPAQVGEGWMGDQEEPSAGDQKEPLALDRTESVVLALLRGLADAGEVFDGGGGSGGRVRMEWWPVPAPPSRRKLA
jgi:anti-sigma regulatory factor (Ser/Thr protein kinase)